MREEYYKSFCKFIEEITTIQGSLDDAFGRIRTSLDLVVSFLM